MNKESNKITAIRGQETIVHQSKDFSNLQKELMDEGEDVEFVDEIEDVDDSVDFIDDVDDYQYIK